MADNDIKVENIHSYIWQEVSESDNPFVASTCYCNGYDVYGDLLGKVSWFEYLYLMFNGEAPSSRQICLLENLAVALANPGPRDHSVRAAMSGGAPGSGNAACLMAALAVGAGNLAGGHEVLVAMQGWQACGIDLDKWKNFLCSPQKKECADVWHEMEHSPGFDPYGMSCSTPVRQTLDVLVECETDVTLAWLRNHRKSLEQFAKRPLAMSGVAAAALYELGLTPEQGEMLYLLFRLPGAAVHALEQKKLGWQKYPFCSEQLRLTDDPGEPGA